MIDSLWDRFRSDVERFGARGFIQDVLEVVGAGYVAIFVGTIFSLFFARLAGPGTYGTYRLVFATVTTIGLIAKITSAVKKTVVTKHSEAVAQEQERRAKQLLQLLSGVGFATGLLATVVGIVLSPVLATYYYGDPELALLLAVASVNTLLINIKRIPNGLLHTAGDMRRFSIFSAVASIVDRTFPLLFFVVGYGVLGAIVGNAILGPLITIVIGVIFVRRSSIDFERPTITGVKQGLLENRDFVGNLTIGSIAATLFSMLPLMILGAEVSDEAVGYLSIAFFGVRLADMLATSIAKNLNPRLPKSARAEPEEFVEKLKKSSIYSVLVMTAITLVGIAGTPFVVPLVLGNEYAPAVPVAIVLFARSFGSGFGAVVAPAYRTLDKIQYSVIVNTGVYAVLIVAALKVIPAYGVMGAAAIIGLGNILTNVPLFAFLWLRLVPEFERTADAS